MDLLLFYIQFDDISKSISGQLVTVREALLKLESSVNLKRVFKIILSIGNFLNAGSKKGQAYGNTRRYLLSALLYSFFDCC
jgi:hypothetical protein